MTQTSSVDLRRVWSHGRAHRGGRVVVVGKSHSLATAMRSPPGAQNQTLQRLQQVLHADSGPCLPHLLSRLCQDLGPGAFRMAARMYLQKGRCWW